MSPLTHQRIHRMAIHPPHPSRLLFLMLCQCATVMAAAAAFSKTLPCEVHENASERSLLVDCTDRHLEKIPKGIPANVTSLTLAINRIPDADGNSFGGFQILEELDFRCNCIPIRMGPKDHVCTTGLHIQNGTFAKLHNLKRLYLDGNQLSAVPQGLPPNLHLLSLEANKIFALKKEHLSALRSLNILLLGQNCYHRNPCNVSYSVEETAFQGMRNLTVLSLKSNNLTSFPQQLPNTLKKLFLYNNRISDVGEHDLSNLTYLETLDLSGNCPRCYNAPYPCEPCHKNASLFIHPAAFDCLKRLKVLRLHSTSLRKVDHRWFKNTGQLEILDLSQNYLASEIEKAQFLMLLPNLVDLDLSFNYELQEYRPYLNLSRTFSTLSALETLRIRGYVFHKLDLDTLQYLRPLKNLTTLDLGTNFITSADLSMFKEFPGIKIINLSVNKIFPSSKNSNDAGLYSIPRPSVDQYNNIVLQETHYFEYDEYARSCKDKNKFVVSFLSKSPCTQYENMLDLSNNNIFFINPSDFQSLTHLKCLNLSGNAMSQTLEGNEFRPLSGLKYLDFSNNRLDLPKATAFQELKELEVLDLSNNKYYFQAKGITRMLGFTRNLVKLHTLIMNGNEIFTSTDKGFESSSLRKLEFRKNRLDILWRDGTTKFLTFFRNLPSLKHLDISDNSLSYIRPEAFYGLPSDLEELILANNKLRTFNWAKLQVLKKLKRLDLSNNQLTTVPRELVNCSVTLQNLTMQNNRITKLTENFLQNAVNLIYLDLSFNKIRTIKNSSFPENMIKNLKTLILNGNPFKCNCDFVWFVWWINQTNVPIPFLATGVTCASPGVWKGKSVVSLALNTCELDKSKLVFFISVLAITCIMIIPVTSHLYYWDMWKSFHFCIAKLNGYSHFPSGDVVYDAFVVYDKKDTAVTEWVLKELVEELEGQTEKPYNLCLEERDWLPGQPVLENLSASIQMSRKTIFVLTMRYIASGNFKTAFYMAHQRLMDEKVDVVILIFLEKVLQKNRYFHLRKRLPRRSVLEWPSNPQSHSYFWQCLKNALAANNDWSSNKLWKEMS